MFITLPSRIVQLMFSWFPSSVPLPKNIKIQLLWQPRIWEYLLLYTILYLGWLPGSLSFEYQERDNIVLQSRQLRGVLLIATMTGPNLGNHENINWTILDGNVITMTRGINSINITICFFRNDQRHVHRITIKNSSTIKATAWSSSNCNNDWTKFRIWLITIMS